jgi:predicted kinase
MGRTILVCGPTGVGKTTYSIATAREIGAVRFSIDPWMQTLFAADMTSLDYAWMIERVGRCYEQIWSVSEQILALGGSVVLDLGFTEKAERTRFAERSSGLGVVAEVHCLQAPPEVRRARVDKRNAEQDPAVYAFEVTEAMFDFMEPRFETPDEDELAGGRLIEAR